MANYICTCRTNYFRVTDEDAYKELMSHVYGDDMYTWEQTDESNVIRHAFGCYGNIWYTTADEIENDNIDDFLDEIQKLLPDDEAFMYMESGNEKLRYVTGYASIVTKNEIKHYSLEQWLMQEAKKTLGENFTTQLDY